MTTTNRPDAPRPAIVVVGGGLAGLTAAVAARRLGAHVTLLEPHPPGGRGRVDHRGEYAFNRGPRALYRGGAAERTLASLGIDVGTGAAPVTRGALAIDERGPHLLPISGGALARTSLLGLGEKRRALRHLLALLRAPGALDPATSLATWLDERRTPPGWRRLLEAMVRLATYIDAPHLLSAADALGQAHRASTRGVHYLDGGFGAIVDALATAATLEGVDLRQEAVRRVAPDDDGWRVATAAGSIDADAVILAVGSPDAAAQLLGHRPAAWQALGPAARAACLELGVRRVPRHRFALGIDRPTYLSVHAPPARLAPEGHGVVHVLRYRSADDDIDHDQVRRELHDLARTCGVADDDIVEERYLAAMEVTAAIPTAAAGGIAGRPPVRVAEHPGLHVAGDWVGAEGLLLDAALASASLAAEQAATRAVTMVRR